MANIYAQIEDANWQVAECQQRLDDQLARIGQLESGNHDATDAKAMLHELEMALSRAIEQRDWLLGALVADQRVKHLAHGH